MDDFEIVEVEPELEPLFRALLECDIQSHRVLANTLQRLSAPPKSLYLPQPDRIALMNQVIESIGFDQDMAARTLRLHEGSPNPEAAWKGLTRVERKRAKRLWEWVLDARFEAAPQGRPADIDGALIVYCARIIAEACQTAMFKFSRPPGGGTPHGPMWQALMAALPLAKSSLIRADGAPAPSPLEISDHAEAVASVVTTMRSPEFQACCRELGIGTTADNVAEQPGSFRYALTLARAQRRELRPKRRRPAIQK
jgi:hypothetical protein